MGEKSTIEDIYRFYRQHKESHGEILQRLKRRIYHVGTIRLLLIVGMFVTLWLLRNHNLPVLIAITGVYLFCFALLVVYHARLHHKRTYEECLIRYFENELKALDYDFSAFDGAPEQADTQHAFSMDLDVFGDKSLFQMVNRTVTAMGKERLVNRFKQPLSSQKIINMHQEGVREMKELSGFRHHFYVAGETASKTAQNINYLFSKDNFYLITGNRFLCLLIWVVPALWALLITGYILQWIPAIFLVYYCVAGYLIANIPFKRIQQVTASGSKTEKILQTYSELMEQIEKEHFNSSLLNNYRSEFIGRTENASRTIKCLSRNIGALDQRFSLMGVLLNILYMRDTRQAMKLERWKQRFAWQLPVWFDALGVFDVFCSYGAFAFNHPGYTYPVLTYRYFEMEGKALGHPLIHRDQCVCNNVHIPKDKFFLIVTGANMAGKSTFLRTVGVNLLFSCMGLPVFAESLSVYPAQLVTSLRTADSLVSNESYFFAELKRLKMIIDRLDAGEELLIILDEILKGTNSVDKQKGSIALVKQLISKNTCGIIATHDILLGSLSDTFPENVQNKRFEADINGDELTFTYQLRDGIAQNMNATFLMKKMGIY
jgi:DNA mismatch repair ATPase MutS